MNIYEKRKAVKSYCECVECDECVLKGNNWDEVYCLIGEECINIATATGDDLDKALELIGGVKTTDNVNHPAHYQGANECIDVMIAMFGVEAVKAFCKCNAYKYRFRSNAKNGDEDIKKAEWYETKLIELENMRSGSIN